MVTEKDLALLDSYLSNELEGQARTDFEKRLDSDASLKSEYKLQKELIEGIKQARMAELKTMLNQTPIPPSSSTGSVAAKVSLWLLAASVVVGGLYYYLKNDEQPASEQPAMTMEQPAEPLQQTPAEQPAEKQPDAAVTKDEPAKKESRAEKPATQQPEKTTGDGETETQPATGVRQPELDLYDPTEESADNREKPEPAHEGSSVKVAGSSIPVQIEEGNKKFNFHYQFKDGKLFLYGSFEKELYEILEFFNNNKRTVFLYYNTNYYLLDETQEKPAPLKAITDQALLRKLHEYREGQ